MTTEPNPFHERASARLLKRGHLGGQHEPSAGDSTRDPVLLPSSAANFDAVAKSDTVSNFSGWPRDRLLFDIDSAPPCEPRPVPHEGATSQLPF